jgi:hypothetical protein
MPAEWVGADGAQARDSTSYAKSEGEVDAARIWGSSALSADDREEFNSKLRFFEGHAWQIYGDAIRPALQEQARAAKAREDKAASRSRIPVPPLPTVSTARALLKRAEELACSAPPDFDAAYAILTGLEDWLDSDANRNRRADAFRSMGFAKQSALLTTGYAIDAISNLRRQTSLWRNASPTTPMRQHVWRYYRTTFDIGTEFLEVVTGERAVNQTITPALEAGAWTTIDIYVTSLPVVGSLVSIGEATLGRDLSGRKLSPTERALIGGLTVLSEIGTIFRATEGVTSALRLSALSRLSNAALQNVGRMEAVMLVAGARALTSRQKALLRQFAQLIRSGARLSADQLLEATRLLAKVDEGAMIAVARSRNARQLATGVGVLVEAGAKPSAVERHIAAIVQEYLGAPNILALAEREVVPTAEFLLGRTLIDAYAPTTSKVANLVGEIGKKHRQAGVIAVDLSRAPVRTAQVEAEISRVGFWGHPDRVDISRIIVIDGGRVTADLARPSALTLESAATAGGTVGRAATRAGYATRPSGDVGD